MFCREELRLIGFSNFIFSGIFLIKGSGKAAVEVLDVSSIDSVHQFVRVSLFLTLIYENTH